MKEIIAYCGINCAECPAYIATQNDDFEALKKVAKEWSSESMIFQPKELYCDGCNSTGKLFQWCAECPIRKCSREKGFENCAYCEDYFCDNLKMTFDKTPAAKERLDKIRMNL